jgi:putative transposase
MRHSAFSDAAIMDVVRDLEAGRPAQEICAAYQVSPRTLFRWRRKFGDLKPFAVRALRHLEQENHRLKVEASRAGTPPAASASQAPFNRSDLGTGHGSHDTPRVATVVGRYAALRLR